MDSEALRLLWDPDVLLYVDMGTQYAGAEQSRLSDEVVVDYVPLNKWSDSAGIIPLRNLMLCCIAAQYGEDVALGATAGDRVLDKSSEFARLASELLSYLWQPQHWTDGKSVTIHLPLKALTKVQIVQAVAQAGKDVAALARRSFSCYTPNADGRECGACKPCWRKWVAFEASGFGAALEVDARPFVEAVVVPGIASGTESRGDEGADVMQAVTGERPDNPKMAAAAWLATRNRSTDG
jgi:7-cyano-7-deazaguanine synthase in queuosine biosynthesis